MNQSVHRTTGSTTDVGGVGDATTATSSTRTDSLGRVPPRTSRIVDRSRQLAALNAIASSVNQSLDFQDTLKTAAKQVPHLTGFDAGLILLTDKNSDGLTLSAHHGLSETLVSPLGKLSPGDRIITPALRTGEPMLGEVPRNECGPLSECLRRGGFWFFVAMPLRAKARTMGIMVLASHGPRHIDLESSHFLLSVGDVIGVAIENASLYRDVGGLLEETRRQATRLKESERQSRAVAELGRRALSGMDLPAMINDTAGLVVKTLGVEYCYVLEINPDRQSMILLGGMGWAPHLLGQEEVSLSQETQAGYTVHTNGPVIVEDLGLDGRFPGSQLLRRHGVVSGTTVLIPGQNGPFGVLGAHTTRGREFSNDEIHFLQSIANVLAEGIERKRAEEALTAETERLTVTLRSIADGVITTDTQGRVVLMNRVAETLTGWTQEEAKDVRIGDVFHIREEKSGKRWEHPVKLMPDTEEAVGEHETMILVGKDRAERLITYEASPMRGRDGQIVGAVVAFRDVTEKQRMEAERLRAQKLESIGLLAGGIAHDFNNLLMGILGNLSLAKMDAEGNERMLDRLTAAERACLQSKNLTQQLLTFSRGGSPIKRTTSINGFIQETAEFVLRGTNVRCQLSTPDSLWPADVDEGQMSQVIQNMILNAQQAMHGGGTIRVRTENVTVKGDPTLPVSDGRYVKIAIEDQGVGIPQENLARVFDPYFTTKEKGNGLGLATAYSIVKKHEGSITVESKVGIGTTFTIYLPASSKRAADVPSTESKPLSGRGRVLVMDDEKLIRDVTGHILKRLGYEVEFASDGAQAIEVYQKARGLNNPIDVVIMDLTIPGGMGGREAIKRLLEVDPQVKAIVSSGYSNDPVMADFQNHGFRGCVAKPYKIQELCDTLKQLLH